MGYNFDQKKKKRKKNRILVSIEYEAEEYIEEVTWSH